MAPSTVLLLLEPPGVLCVAPNVPVGCSFVITATILKTTKVN